GATGEAADPVARAAPPREGPAEAEKPVPEVRGATGEAADPVARAAPVGRNRSARRSARRCGAVACSGTEVAGTARRGCRPGGGGRGGRGRRGGRRIRWRGGGRWGGVGGRVDLRDAAGLSRVRGRRWRRRPGAAPGLHPGLRGLLGGAAYVRHGGGGDLRLGR